MSVFSLKKKGSNYAVIEHNGEMVMQIMHGGSLADGVSIINNSGDVIPVHNAEEAQRVANGICDAYLARKKRTGHREYVKAQLIAAHFAEVRRRGR